ncbi:MAG: histidine--tRNA ligase [Candidatus Omnitrophica bacterium]|nr:histidine--tRNA ligase [Candidatus Omnitrophota bacterium]
MMKKIYTGIRGTCDFTPSKSHSFNKITQTARQIFKVFGYEEVILPLLEEEDLFKRGVGETTEIVERQMFKIQGKSIVLRPEGTAQVVRYYLENSLYKQSDFHKFSYIGAMFRGERPQKGRLRQFHHIGAEAIGSDSFYLDGEIIALSMKILEGIGIQEKQLLINSLGCLEDKEKFSQKIKKILNSKKDKLCPDCQRRLERNPLRVLDCKRQECRGVVTSLNLGKESLCSNCKSRFENLLFTLDNLKIKYTQTPYLVRGLDYYTNVVFEIISGSLGSQDALGAGGRYNNLVRDLGGPDIPGIGFSLGIERILLALKTSQEEKKIKVFIITASETLLGAGFKILQRLREQNLACDMDYCGKSLKGQLRYACKRGAKYVVILGEEEWKEQCVMLKDMEKSVQEKVKIEDLAALLKKYMIL